VLKKYAYGCVPPFIIADGTIKIVDICIFKHRVFSYFSKTRPQISNPTELSDIQAEVKQYTGSNLLDVYSACLLHAHAIQEPEKILE